MLRVGPYEFKLAETPEELEQVHRLNYQTFVQEIHQHPDSGSGVLVDKFHRKNSYLIGLREGRLIAMLSYHDQPPFSVVDRMPDPAVLAEQGVRPLEVRLLAIEPGERQSTVVGALMWCLLQNAKANGHTHFVISGVVEQKDFYTHMGFETLGPPVGQGRACYIPMWATLDRVGESLERTLMLWARRMERQGKSG